VDILIALGHSGYERDQEIARDVPQLDLVVGGHSHSLLYTGTGKDVYLYIPYMSSFPDSEEKY
jgi:5'-nucleotidase